MSGLDVTVVVPVYGGQDTIADLCHQLRQALGDAQLSFEILFVCDAPRDNSWAVARTLSEQYPEVVATRLRSNVGQHAALLLGIRDARGRVTVTMDEDLQHAPLDVPALVKMADSEDAIVYGVTKEQHHGLFRGFSSWLSKWVLRRFFGVANASAMSAFRAFPTEYRDAFAGYRNPQVAIDVLLSWTGVPVRALHTAHQPRAAGKSGYTTAKLVKHMGNLVFGFSVAPLRFASSLGLVAMTFALLVGAYAVVNWLLMGSPVPGFAFLATTIGLLGGAQLLALGVVGEYLGRLYIGSLHQPQYQVAERAGATEPS